MTGSNSRIEGQGETVSSASSVMPIEGDQLTGERVTVVVAVDGSREVLHDDWTCQRTWQRPGPWGGYTFLPVSMQHSRRLPQGMQQLELRSARNQCQ